MIYAGAVDARLGAVVLDEVHYLGGPLPRAGVGGGDPAPAPHGRAGVPVGHGLQPPGGGRLAQPGARPDRGGGRDPAACAAHQPVRREPAPLRSGGTLAHPGRRGAEPEGRTLRPPCCLPPASSSRPVPPAGRPDTSRESRQPGRPDTSRESRQPGRPDTSRESRQPGRPDTSRESRQSRHGRELGPSRQPAHRVHRGHQRGLPWRPPRRVDLLDELSERGLLPVIWFVFSRQGMRPGCGPAWSATESATPTTPRRPASTSWLRPAPAVLDPGDLDALGARRWAARLRLGIASHHAGMVPVFKEVVERCFAEGLVQVVFATETLALGVNMPARSVGDRQAHEVRRPAHRPRSAQPSTRSSPAGPGRRGIDEAGWAVALWSPECAFEEVAELALKPVFRAAVGLRSHLQHGGLPAGSHARGGGPRPAGPLLRPAPGPTLRPRR